MPCRLLVILGAGASYDCASGLGGALHGEFRPPLVTQLFDNRPSFTRILSEYPLAQKAAAEIRPAVANGSVAIEAFLRERLRDSEFAHDRRQFWSIPLYLQHLLFMVSRWDYPTGRGYAEQPDSYDRLINAALRTDEVTFVTLNYDDIFDQRLLTPGSPDSMEAYLGLDEKWALIKLHGSINWGRAVVNPPDLETRAADPSFARMFGKLGDSIQLANSIVLRPQDSVAEMRLEASATVSDHLYYPALSAPLGVEDELVCPPDHIEYLKRVTGHWDPLNVLVIGYSGLDQEVIKLLSWGGRAVRSLWVVNESEASARATAERITANIKVIPAPGTEGVVLVGTGFTGFAQSDHLAEYITHIREVAAREDEQMSLRRMGLQPPP